MIIIIQRERWFVFKYSTTARNGNRANGNQSSNLPQFLYYKLGLGVKKNGTSLACVRNAGSYLTVNTKIFWTLKRKTGLIFTHGSEGCSAPHQHQR